MGMKEIAKHLNEHGQLMRGRTWGIQKVYNVLSEHACQLDSSEPQRFPLGLRVYHLIGCHRAARSQLIDRPFSPVPLERDAPRNGAAQLVTPQRIMQ